MSAAWATGIVLAATATLAVLAMAAAVRPREAPSETAPPDSVVTLTAVMAQGVWTDEEVTAVNSRRRDFRAAHLVLRKGRTVRLRLKSADVVHAFSAPWLGIDPVEVYPGRVVEIAVTPLRAAAFEYYCTIVCGETHFAMRGFGQVVTGPDPPAPPPTQPGSRYWLAEKPEPGARPAALGAWHYRQRGCITCHGDAGRGGVPNPNSMNEVVPDLATLARRVFLFTRVDVEIFRDALGAARLLDPSSEAAGIPLYTSVKAQYLAYRQLIQDGRRSARLEASGPRPPLDMPAWRSRLTGREIDLILAYLLDRSDEAGAPARPAAVVSKGEVQ